MARKLHINPIKNLAILSQGQQATYSERGREKMSLMLCLPENIMKRFSYHRFLGLRLKKETEKSSYNLFLSTTSIDSVSAAERIRELEPQHTLMQTKFAITRFIYWLFNINDYAKNTYESVLLQTYINYLDFQSKNDNPDLDLGYYYCQTQETQEIDTLLVKIDGMLKKEGVLCQEKDTLTNIRKESSPCASATYRILSVLNETHSERNTPLASTNSSPSPRKNLQGQNQHVNTIHYKPSEEPSIRRLTSESQDYLEKDEALDRRFDELSKGLDEKLRELEKEVEEEEKKMLIQAQGNLDRRDGRFEAPRSIFQ